MTPDSSTPRQAIESSLTALLLGELPPDHAAALRELMAHDPELAKLHDRLKHAIELVRETETAPAEPPAAHPEPLKLSNRRRQQLFQHFKTIKPKELAKPRRREVSPVLAVAAGFAVIALLAAALLPAFSKAKSRSMALSSPSSVFENRNLSSPASRRLGLDLRPADSNRRSSPAQAGYAAAAMPAVPAPSVQPVPMEPPPPPASAAAHVATIVLPSTGEVRDASATLPNRAWGQVGDATARSRMNFFDDSGTLRASPAPGGTEVARSGLFDTLESKNGNVALADGRTQQRFYRAKQESSLNLASDGDTPASTPAKDPPEFVGRPVAGPAGGAIAGGYALRKAMVGSVGGGGAQAEAQKPADLPYYVRNGLVDPNAGLPMAPSPLPGQPKKDETLGSKPSSPIPEGKVYSLGVVGYVNAVNKGDLALRTEETSKSTDLAVVEKKRVPILGELPVTGDLFQSQAANAPVPAEEAVADEAVRRQAKSIASDKDLTLTGITRSDLEAKKGFRVDDMGTERQREFVGQRTLNEPDAAKKPAVPALLPIPQPEIQTRDNAFSTFSLNVSDVSFKLAAASLEKGTLPEPASIRSEEFINAFDYRDPEPAPGAPIAFAWERASYPFAQNRDLLRFSLKTAAQGRQPGRPFNIVLLLDNSGSMERADRVRIIHEALRVLAAQLQPQDKLSVVTFARTARLWVDGVPGNQAGKVADDLDSLTPQGGTNLEDALNLAYQTALRYYLANGINRVVLLTDGAANLGDVDPGALKKKVEDHRKQGIALDGFGIGWEGYNDDLLETLTRNGDGRYGFINTPEEAATEFAGQLAGALRVAASDVKVQVEFNPNRVAAYRQIGYAKHQLTKEQFRNNAVDAAEIGAAESGNALYVVEVNPQGDGPLANVRVRYKVPGTTDCREQEWPVPYTGSAEPLEHSTPVLRLAATAGAFSEWLAANPCAAEVTPDRLLGCLAGVPETYGADARPKKLEWMIRQAKSLAGK